MTSRRVSRLVAPLLAVTLGMSSVALASNLVTNGDFESNSGNGQLGYNATATGWSVPNAPGSYAFLWNADGGASGTSADNGGANGQYGNVGLWGPGNGVGNGLTLSPTGGAFVGM